jgi:hypothetical protein
MIMHVAESVGAPSGLPGGIHAEVENSDVVDIHGCRTQSNRIEAVVMVGDSGVKVQLGGPGE